jgi:hypothetical protein
MDVPTFAYVRHPRHKDGEGDGVWERTVRLTGPEGGFTLEELPGLPGVLVGSKVTGRPAAATADDPGAA